MLMIHPEACSFASRQIICEMPWGQTERIAADITVTSSLLPANTPTGFSIQHVFMSLTTSQNRNAGREFNNNVRFKSFWKLDNMTPAAHPTQTLAQTHNSCRHHNKCWRSASAETFGSYQIPCFPSALHCTYLLPTTSCETMLRENQHQSRFTNKHVSLSLAECKKRGNEPKVKQRKSIETAGKSKLGSNMSLKSIYCESAKFY